MKKKKISNSLAFSVSVYYDPKKKNKHTTVTQSLSQQHLQVQWKSGPTKQDMKITDCITKIPCKSSEVFLILWNNNFSGSQTLIKKVSLKIKVMGYT